MLSGLSGERYLEHHLISIISVDEMPMYDYYFMYSFL